MWEAFLAELFAPPSRVTIAIIIAMTTVMSVSIWVREKTCEGRGFFPWWVIKAGAFACFFFIVIAAGIIFARGEAHYKLTDTQTQATWVVDNMTFNRSNAKISVVAPSGDRHLIPIAADGRYKLELQRSSWGSDEMRTDTLIMRFDWCGEISELIGKSKYRQGLQNLEGCSSELLVPLRALSNPRAWWLANNQGVDVELEKAQVVRVIDGDTIVVSTDGADDLRVRLIGVDAPEINEAGGQEAADFLERIVRPGTTVILEFDEVRYDRFGRTLAYVWSSDFGLCDEAVFFAYQQKIKDGITEKWQVEASMLQGKLLANGHAGLATFDNVRYAEAFRTIYQSGVDR